MPQSQGAGTIYTGGPGGAKRLPLYGRTYGNVVFSNGNGAGYSFVNLFDKNGNMVAPITAPTTGSQWAEISVAVPNASVLTLYSVGTLIIPAPGAGLYIDVKSMVLNNIYKTAAFTSGDPIQLNYGTGVSAPASVTVAATFLTSPTANQAIKVAGALATTLSSAVINTGVYLTVGTQDFATGGGSLVVNVEYRIVALQ